MSRFYAAILAAPLGLGSLHAADIIKANNTTALNDASSWQGGVLPTANDIAVFNATSATGGVSVPVGGNVTFQGIRVEANPGTVTISGLVAQTINLGSGGLNFANATTGTNVDIDSPTLAVGPGVGATFRAGSGVSSTLWGGLNINGGSVTVDASGTNTGSFFAEGFGTLAAIMHNAVVRTDSSVNFATIQDGNRKLIPADALGVANPSDGGNSTLAATLTTWPSNGYVDVTNSNALAASTAFTLTNANTFPGNSGIRFNQPHATAGTDWVVGFAGNNSRIQPGSPFSILVTPNVGARNVIFSNLASNGNEFRYNNSSGRFNIHQFNTAGDLIWRGDITTANTSTTALTRFTKSGPGRVILSNPTFPGSNNPVDITEGTLQIGEGGAVGTINNNPVFNNGSLVFNRSGALTHSGVITGAGSLTFNILGNGSFALNGANTFTGPVAVNAGTLILGNASSLGTASQVTLAGGTGVQFSANVTTDLTTRNLAFTGNGTVNIDTAANDVTLASTIGGNGTISVTKAGSGTLTLGGANAYTGNTAINAGGLRVINSTGSATGSGNVTMASGTVLSGTGTISGSVSIPASGRVQPGVAGVGSLTVGRLSLASGSLLDLDFASTSSNDRVVTTASNGLTINGGALQLIDVGTGLAWKTPGTYNLFQYSGAVQGTGPSALSVSNPQAGYSYTFGATGSFLTLLIELDAILSQWTSIGSGSWSAGSSWGNGVPTSGYTAQFTTALAAPATVTLDGSRTVNGLVFTSPSPNGYTIAQGTGGSLILDKGVKNAAVNVTQGDHVISAPVVLSSTLAAGIDANSSLTISGVVSGAGGVTKTGPGTLNLNGNNSFTGSVIAMGGTLGFANASSLGSGSLTVSGATLRYGAGNTADISTKVFTIGQDGATIDTNGNDVVFLNAIGNGGAGALTKAGAGVLSLAFPNNYSGNTIVKGGFLQVDANDRLGALGGALVLDGGSLATSANVTLSGTASDNSTVSRPLVVSSGNGTLNVAANTTLSISGAVSGTGNLVKDGAGVLSISSTGSTATKSGGVTLRNGTLRINLTGSVNVQDTLGAGTITLEGGVLNAATSAGNTLSVANSIEIPSGKTATFNTPNRFALAGAMTGNGTLNMTVNTDVARADFSNNWAGFNGTLNISGTGTVRLLNNGGGFNTAGLANAAVNATGITFNGATNSGGNTFIIGSLSGNTSLTNSVGSFSTWQIGGRNESSVFSGNFVRGNNFNSLIKVGTGTLTINGATLQDGLTTVSAGTLLVDSVIPASTATAPTAPARFVTVATGATLGGSGTITPDAVVNGILRPDPTGLRGGQLTFGGVLELTATATTQFDFSGASFTGVKSTSATAGSVTLNGPVKLNFLGTVFNGSYRLFEIAAATAGTGFTGVFVTTTTTAETALTDEGGGVWSGTVGAQTYSFNTSTGTLTVTGGATPVTPGASTLSALAGNAKVDLSWTAANDADTYIVKRATTAGGPYTNVVSNLAGRSYSDTGLVNGTTYFYVVQARNSTSSLFGSNSNEVSATPVAVVYTSLQNWRFEQFGVYDDTANVLAGDTEDFDGDGQVNILEYALGTDPKVPNASPVVVARSGNFLTLTYPRRAVADLALTYTVQGSGDLATAFTAGTGATANVGSTYTYTDDVNVSASGVRRFLRLSVSYTAP